MKPDKETKTINKNEHIRDAMLLYLVTDRSWLGEKTLAYEVEEALKNGVTCVQLREKNLNNNDFLEEALEIKASCRKYGVPFLVNDNVEVAVVCDADGVHVGQEDMDVSNVRKIIGGKKIIGVSVQTVDQAIQAEKSGADYLGVGTVFPTKTKADADFVKKDTLEQICKAVDIPVVAIGGITADNIVGLKGTGIDGIAVVSAILATGNTGAATRTLLSLAEKMVDE